MTIISTLSSILDNRVASEANWVKINEIAATAASEFEYRRLVASLSTVDNPEAALKTDDVERIKNTSEALKKALQGVGSAIYGQGGDGGDGSSGDAGAGSGGYDGPSSGDAGTGSPHDENTVEGEYKEV